MRRVLPVNGRISRCPPPCAVGSGAVDDDGRPEENTGRYRGRTQHPESVPVRRRMVSARSTAARGARQCSASTSRAVVN